MAIARVLVGPPRSGKTERAISEFVSRLRESGSRSAVYIVPTQRVADAVRGEVLRRLGAGVFDYRVVTFAELGDLVLLHTGAPVAAISQAQRMAILRSTIAELAERGELEALGQWASMVGLAAAVMADIDELKVAGIEPEQFQAELAHCTAANAVARDVARIYAAYQQRLQAAGLYDEAGRFWWAEVQMRQGPVPPLDELQLVVVDGFSDFTTLQLRVLARLVEWAGEALITLTRVADEERVELRAIPQRTLRALRQHLGAVADVRVEELQGAEGAETCLGRLVVRLFDPAARPEADADGTVRIIEAPGVWAEVRAVAREIKRLIAEGEARTEDIAIVARTLDPYQRALRQVFHEYGLPLFVSRGEPVLRRSPARLALDLVALCAEDFPRLLVCSVAANPLVDLEAVAGPGADAAVLEEASRAASIAGGAENWRRALERLAEASQAEVGRIRQAVRAGEMDEFEAAGAEKAAREMAETAPKALAVFEALYRAVEPLRREAPRHEMAAALLQVLDALGVGERVLVQPELAGDEHEVAADVRAWNMLVAALRELVDLGELAGSEPISPAQFLAELRELLGELRIHPEGRGEGRIVALDVHDALQTSFKFVFLVGLTEGMFPLRRDPDPLLSEQLRAQLEARGLPVRERRAMQDEEAYLFHLAISVARERLYLCYPTADANGEPLLRSYYCDEIERLLGEVPARRFRLSDVVPEPEDACSPSEALQWAVMSWVGSGDARGMHLHRAVHDYLLAAGDRRAQAAVLAEIGAAVERRRDGFLPRTLKQAAVPDAFCGVLADREIRQKLGRRFGPTHPFSATQFSAFGSCPMQFFFRYILKAEELVEPRPEVSPADIGALVHQALRDFYVAWTAGGGGIPVGEEVEEAWPLLQEALAEAIERFERRGPVGHAALWEATKELLYQRLRRWLEAEESVAREVLDMAGAEGGPLPRPFKFEQPFGAGRDGALELEVPRAGTIRVVGRIDRVDIVEGRGLAVCDYKTGSVPSREDLFEGRDFQLTLYAMAVERMFGHLGPCVAAFYWRVGEVEAPPWWASIAGADSIQDHIEEALDRIGIYVENMRSGQFHLPAACEEGLWCPYRDICRYTPWRARLIQALEG